MKRNIVLIGSIFWIVLIMTGCSAQDDFPVLLGEYLGQKPPGLTLEIFAPGIISTEKKELNSVFTPDGFGKGDLHISFHKQDGSWTKLRNMRSKINTSGTEYCPMLSADGQYFFYTSTQTGNGDIYWVNAQIIEELKPADLK